MLFNSHPVADLMRNEINEWREFHERVQKQREEFNKKYNVSDDSILLKVRHDEFDFNDMFFSINLKKVVSDWSRFDVMLEMKRKFNLTDVIMDEDYDFEYQY
jgi:hypothetical protein